MKGRKGIEVPQTLMQKQKGELEKKLISLDDDREQLLAQSIIRVVGASGKEIETQEFAGLTLDSARQLYLSYNTTRDQHQAQLKQLLYLSQEILRDDFELSSVTNIDSDPVIHDLVHRASETAVLLGDGNNRSLREQAGPGKYHPDRQDPRDDGRREARECPHLRDDRHQGTQRQAGVRLRGARGGPAALHEDPAETRRRGRGKRVI